MRRRDFFKTSFFGSVAGLLGLRAKVPLSVPVETKPETPRFVTVQYNTSIIRLEAGGSIDAGEPVYVGGDGRAYSSGDCFIGSAVRRSDGGTVDVARQDTMWIMS